MKRSAGFTLIELLITIAVAAILGALVVPNLFSMVDAGKTSVLVNQIPQDVAWARNQAVTSQQAVLMKLGPQNCTWTTTVGGAPSNEHSMSAAQVAAQYPNVTCTISTGAPQTLTFDTQGFIQASPNANLPTITITAGAGQSWTLQLLASGSVILNSDTAS